MSDIQAGQQKEKAAKVRHKPERERVLLHTFAANRHNTTNAEWTESQQQGGNFLQRQCACGTHTIGGGECHSCRQKRASNFLQRTTNQAVPDAEVITGLPSVINYSPTTPTHDFSQIPTHTITPQPVVQPKFTFGPTGGQAPQEAGRVVNYALNMPVVGGASSAVIGYANTRLRSVQRQMLEEKVQTKPFLQPTGTIQRDDITSTNISETTDTGNKYTQELVLNKTKARITVYLGVNWIKKGTWASDDVYQKFIRKVKTAAYSYLDNKFKVECVPKAKGAGSATIDLPIDFIIYDFDSGYKIEAHGGTPGGDSAMAQSGGEVYEFDSDDDPEEAITYAHEFGHAILGASDEYANPKVPGRVLTNDHSIMANYYAQGKDQAEFKARHFQHIVTEVAKAFAGYTCSIKEM